MRNIVLRLIVLILAVSLHGQENVVIGIFNLPPYMMEVGHDKKPGGAAIDFWRTCIAPNTGEKIEIVGAGPFPPPRLFTMLEKGEVDVVNNITRVPEREKLFLYSESYLAEISSCLIVRKDSPITKVTRQEDLFDKTIGFIVGGYVPPLLQHERITFDLISDTDYGKVLLDKLLAKRFDACLHINYISLLYDLRLKGYEDKVRVVLLPVDKVKVYSIFRKSEKGERLREMFDRVNRTYYKTDTYLDLARKYLAK